MDDVSKIAEGIVSGSQLLLRHMPYPMATKILEWVGSDGWDHCASVLLDEETGKLMVYEAYPPECRKVTLEEYIEEMIKWKAKRPRWRRRTDKFFECEIYTPPGDVPEAVMWNEAENWLGTRYGMVVNWAFGTSAIHCSELQRRVLEQIESMRGSWANEDPSKTEPVENREVLIKHGWSCRELDLG
jgi:hypothetical protein